MKDQNIKNRTNQTAEAELISPQDERLTAAKRLRLFVKEYRYLWLAMAIPAFLVLLIYLVRGLYPFGNGTVLVLDLNGQYADFFMHLRACILEGNSFLYSWARSMGGEFVGMYTYYLASPLSYLVCLFPKDMIQEFLLCLIILKAAICGGAMGFYLHNRSHSKNKLLIISFAVMYAMSSYCVFYQSNTMWIDAVMWLPIVIYGVEQLVKYGRYKVFVIFLSLTLMSNYYIGYMVCIFVMIYFFYMMFAYKGKNAESNPMGEEKHFLKSFIRIALFSLLAIGISTVIILCAYYSLTFGKTEFDKPEWDFVLNFDIFDFFFKLLPSSYDTYNHGGLPVIYCGVLTIVSAPLFFFSKRFTAREKYAAGAVLLILIFSFMFLPLNQVWHGFQDNQCLNYRYSFVFCFFMVCLAFRTLDHSEDIKHGPLAGISAFIILFVAVLQKFSDDYKAKLVAIKYGPEEKDFTIHTYATMLLTVILVIAFIYLITLMKSKKKQELVSVILLSVICVEVFLSGLCNIIDFDKDAGFSTHEKFNGYHRLMRPVVETLTEEYDTSFYRFDKTYHRMSNDAMAMDIRGLTGSTSTLNAETIAFLKKMGYNSASHKSRYVMGQIVGDSLLGLKYIISEKDLSSLYGEPVLTGQDYANHLEITLDELKEQTYAEEYWKKSSDDINVYYNPYALSLAFAVDGFDALDAADDKNAYRTPFDFMNAVITELLGEDETVEIFKQATSAGAPAMDGAEFEKVYQGNNKYIGKGGKITYTYTVPEGSMLYAFFPTDLSRNIKISSPTMKIFDGQSTLKTSNASFILLGSAEKSEYKLTVEINNDSATSGQKLKGQFYVKDQESLVYYLDMAVMEEAFSRLKENQLIIDDEYTEDRITGTMTTDKNGQTVLTSIAYDEGWQVFVDGERVEITKAAQALISFDIADAGEHTVEFRYRPACFTLGIAVSIVFTLIFIFIMIFESKLRRIKVIDKLFPSSQSNTESETFGDNGKTDSTVAPKSKNKKN